MKTLIFGAGASIPFFNPTLDTAYLTEKVCSQAEWERMRDLYIQHHGKNQQMLDAGIIIQVINDIKRIQPEVNFEQIAEVIDKISSWGFDRIPCHNMLNMLVFIFNLGFQPRYSSPFGIEWQDVPFLLRQIIAETILDLKNNHKSADYQKLIEQQREFVRAICDRDEDVNVISLNYDECILESLEGLGFEKGFRPTDYNYLMQMDIHSFLQAQKVVYFPHGHIRFMFTDNDNVTYYTDSNMANQERWENIDGSMLGSTATVTPGKFAYNYNTFLSTGQTKDEGFNHLPYAVYYQRMAVDLYKSDTVFIIGYSFGDDHINRLLRSFIKMDRQNRVIIVGFNPYQIDLTDTSENSNSTIHKIHYYLGTDWQLTYTEGMGLMANNPHEIDKINTRGYGQLFPQVYFYRLGYEAFLDSFNSIPNLI